MESLSVQLEFSQREHIQTKKQHDGKSCSVSQSSVPPLPTKIITILTSTIVDKFCLLLNFMLMESYRMYSVVSGFFHSTLCLYDLSMVKYV